MELGSVQSRVLIVDDNSDFTLMLRKLFEKSDCLVCIAGDGVAAMVSYREFQPDVVLLDLGLPKLDGYEVCRKIRQEKGSEAVLIAILSGYGREQDKMKSIEAGANFHFVKPTNHQSLLGLLAYVNPSGLE
jgi:DNA-binding response OmpR family regulator